MKKAFLKTITPTGYVVVCPSCGREREYPRAENTEGHHVKSCLHCREYLSFEHDKLKFFRDMGL